MKRWVIRGVICAALFSSACAVSGQRALPVAEQARIENVINSLGRGVYLAQVALSPDGQRLAWVEGGRGSQQIRVSSTERPTQSRLVAVVGDADCNDNEIAWSPDSQSLAILSDCTDQAQRDLYLSRLDGKPAQKLIAFHGYVDSPAFSPDGEKIAFLYVEGSSRPAGALAAETPPSGVIGADNVEVQRVAAVTVPSTSNSAERPDQSSNASLGSRGSNLESTFSFLTPPNLHVFEFDWAPDSQSLAYVAADPPGENNWWVAKLYTQQPGEAPKAILAPVEVSGPLHGLQIAVPRWSPDGKQIAFIGGLMSDQGVTGGDLYLISASGGNPKALVHDDATVAWFHWDPRSHKPGPQGDETLDLTEISGGTVNLIPAVEISTGAPEATDAGEEKFEATISDGRLMLSQSAARDGTEAFILSSFSEPPEIWIDAGGKARQLTHFNDNMHSVAGKSVSLEWMNEGFRVQGWLVFPKDYDASKKYPMIVEVHGGPAGAELPRWGAGGSLSPAVFSAMGYFVLLPNPRGSFGQGEAFTEANRKDFGYGDLRDILAGVDTVLAKYPVDAKRIGLTGWSYGGFMTMFAVTQTQRFRAAVAGAGISDWLSYYGENQIDQWMVPYFGSSVYDDPQIYAKSSAIDFIKQAHTPALVVVGDRDGECPAPQSYEFWHALRDLHVPSELVIYPNEGHGFQDPAHIRDVLERAVGWFEEYMPAGN